MPRYRFDHEAEPDWEPLERLAELYTGHAELPALDADDFMYMGRTVAKDKPSIMLYKHIDTRRYLNLDTGGHAYSYRPRPSDRAPEAVTYVAERDLAVAVERATNMDWAVTR